jgi:hypothetical protein
LSTFSTVSIDFPRDGGTRQKSRINLEIIAQVFIPCNIFIGNPKTIVQNDEE